MLFSQKIYTVNDVREAGVILDPLRCIHCQHVGEVTFLQGVEDGTCGKCGAWQLDYYEDLAFKTAMHVLPVEEPSYNLHETLYQHIAKTKPIKTAEQARACIDRLSAHIDEAWYDEHPDPIDLAELALEYAAAGYYYELEKNDDEEECTILHLVE